MFKKLLATVGIGSAKVNLELTNPKVEIGGTLEGVVKIKGGSVEQVVDRIYINLVLISAYGTGEETKHIKKKISTVTVADQMTLKPGQEEIIPVKFKIPLDAPISKGRTKYCLLTGLDIDQALDPTDNDPITIVPNSSMKMVFEALALLDFQEKPRSGDYNGRFQEFEYRPSKFMARRLDEIEIYPLAREQELSVAIQLDKKNRGLFGSIMDDLDLDENYVNLRLPYNQMNSSSQVAEMLREVIEKAI